MFSKAGIAMHQTHFLTSRLSSGASRYFLALAICSALILAAGCKDDDPHLIGPGTLIRRGSYFYEGKILKTDPLTVGWNDLDGQGSALFVWQYGSSQVVFDFQWGTTVQNISSSQTHAFDFTDVKRPVDKTKSTSLVYSGTEVKGQLVYDDDEIEAIDWKVSNLDRYDSKNVEEIRDFFSANGLASEF
jgi:hypothetical protein